MIQFWEKFQFLHMDKDRDSHILENAVRNETWR